MTLLHSFYGWVIFHCGLPSCQCRRCRRRGFNLWVGKIPWNTHSSILSWKIPLIEKSGALQSVGLDMTECTHTHNKSENEITQSCLTLWDPMECSLQGSSVHGIFQARLLEWVAISFSRRSSQPRDQTLFSHIASRCFTIWATREAHNCLKADLKPGLYQ